MANLFLSSERERDRERESEEKRETAREREREIFPSYIFLPLNKLTVYYSLKIFQLLNFVDFFHEL